MRLVTASCRPGDVMHYLDEQWHTATYAGLHADEAPGTVAEMEADFAETRPRLRATDEAKATVRFLLWPAAHREEAA